MGAENFCTVAASTRRRADLGGGMRGPAEEHIEEIMITPLWPLNADTAMSAGLNSPREAKECYHVPLAGEDLPDLVEGDLLMVAGEAYIVESVAEWGDSDIPALHIIVAKVKRTAAYLS